jgi:GDP-L-fucose synthase
VTARAGGRPVLFVTGGRGMVGRNLLAHPGIAAWRVLAPSSRELDLRDKAAVAAYLGHHRPDAAVHLAGVVGGIQANIAEPVRFLAANAEMGLNVVQGCLAAGVGTLINVASSCMYPHALDTALREEMVLSGPCEPTNEGYALAKILTMRLCQYVMREHPGLAYKTLIPCNLYGLWDKFDPKVSHLVAAVIHKIDSARRSGARTVEIWGDGEARREFLFAGDLADALVRALADPAALREVMNIGVGSDHTVNEYYAAAARVVGWEGRFTHDLGRPAGMRRKLLDVGRQRAWGWQARTSLVDGMRAAYRHYCEEVVS